LSQSDTNTEEAADAEEQPSVTDSQDVATTIEDAAISPVTALEEERDQLKDRLVRVSADFDNFRKRSRKDVEQAERRGREAILRELLPVIDNLERAVEASKEAADVAAVRDGVMMVLKQFEDTASRISLARVESVGKRFDPNLHDAFQQVETDEHDPGTIIQEYQPGYMLDDRLLRPAMVVVARKKKPAEPPPEASDPEEE